MMPICNQPVGTHYSESSNISSTSTRNYINQPRDRNGTNSFSTLFHQVVEFFRKLLPCHDTRVWSENPTPTRRREHIVKRRPKIQKKISAKKSNKNYKQNDIYQQSSSEATTHTSTLSYDIATPSSESNISSISYESLPSVNDTLLLEPESISEFAVEYAQTTPKNNSTHKKGIPKYSWSTIRNYLISLIKPSTEFEINNLPFHSWELTHIPTLAACESNRAQKLYRGRIVSSTHESFVFIKKIPLHIWQKQFTSMNNYNGEYITDGENFVMEASILSFFHYHNITLGPTLLGIVLERSANSNSVAHICLISELYGEDLIKYFFRRLEEKTLTNIDRRAIQYDLLQSLKKLHQYGLSHLDFTPENILVGEDGIKICDYAKSTPLYTSRFRHSQVVDTPVPFESCEPTVGKSAYMPPECWRIYSLLEELKIQSPLEDLDVIENPDIRSSFYFKVAPVDIFMLGVMMFWLWSDGGTWKYSDPNKDQQFHTLVYYGMNLDIFFDCVSWPIELKHLLKRLIEFEPQSRESLERITKHNWWHYELKKI